MERRHFLKLSSALPLVAYAPMNWADTLGGSSNHTLVMIQLGGGNDGLNSFVPFNDDAYYSARPNLAIPYEDVLPLSQQLALHPAMSSLMPAWQAGEMAVVHGIGYPQPNRSHFRSIEIWQTASSADEFLTNGWLSEVIAQSTENLSAITVSGSPMSTHGAVNQFNLAGQTDLDKFSSLYIPSASSEDPLMNFIMSSRAQFNESVTELSSLLAQEVTFSVEFPDTAMGQQCHTLAKLMALGFTPKVFHLGLGSFDTHSNQLPAHAALWQELSDAVAALRSALIERGLWQNTTVASYCEFGRRVSENGSGGTDHGTAASHFVIGGGIQGGEYGEMPSLTDLDSGDLNYTTDFRSYFKSLAVQSEFSVPSVLAEYTDLGLS